MKLIGRFLAITIILGTLLALSPQAQAGAFSYAGKRKRIYCGIAQLIHSVIDSAGQPALQIANQAAINSINSSGPLFAKLDAMVGMKPAGWAFENPLAASIDKSDPNYWLVPVASSRNLSRLDVLYLPGSGTISLTDDERENLRRFVDGGGVLWVDNADAASVLKFADNAPLFITQVEFETGGTYGAYVPVSRHHPLVSAPYWLTDVDIMSLGMGVTGAWSPCHYNVPDYEFGSTASTAFDILFPIIDSINVNTGSRDNLPAVVANTYGSGRVVCTANFVGKACLLREPYSLASLKLAYNIISYATTWTDIRKNPRHTGSSLDTVGSQALVEKWSLLCGTPKSIETAPIIYKNTVFYTHGDTLYALDANGDNNYGLWGPKGPTGEVVIWRWSPSAGGGGSSSLQLSSPSVATVQNPDDSSSDCSPIEAVMVMGSDGMVYVLNAFPLASDGSVESVIKPIYAFPTQPGTASSSADSRWPSPPLYVNGWFYAVSGEGRLYAENPCLKKAAKGAERPEGVNWHWEIPSLQTNPSQIFHAIPRCGPSFGYMKGSYSGAVVGSIWWYNSRNQVTPAGGGNNALANDAYWAVPVLVSNDRVKIERVDSAGTIADVRASYPGFLTAPDATNPISAIRLLAADGITPIPVTSVTLNANSSGPSPGAMTITAASPIPPNRRIYASYSLSYKGYDVNQQDTSIQPSMLTREIQPTSMPQGTGGVDAQIMHNATVIAGSPAMGPDNYVYMCGTRQSQAPCDGGSILAYLYDGSNTVSQLKWHYFLHSGLDQANGASYAPAENIQIPGVVYDKNTGLNMMNPQPSASPAVSSGKVFVTVSGEGPAGVPKGALLCFKATSEFQIRITTNAGFDQSGMPIKKPKSLHRQTENGNYHVKIWQPNLINTATGAMPLMDARSVSNGISVDYDNGTITFTDFAPTKLQTRGGVETNTFSPSLPVWVFLDNVAVPIDWSTWGPGAIAGGNTTPASNDSVDLSGWNNLLWYYVIPPYNGVECTGVHSPPTVIGNSVYFVTDEGVLYALSTEEPKGVRDASQSVQKPLWQQQIGIGKVGMPDTAAVSVAGSNGTLMVPGPDGLHAYSNSTTLVADNNRLVEIDGAGDVSWSADSVMWPATTPSATGKPMAIKQGPINRPGRARYASTGEILFANTGADQVCKIDKNGMVGFDGAMGLYARWVYEKFADPRHLLSSGQPTRLRGPTDAVMWQEIEPIPTGSTPATSVVHCLIADSGNSRILDLVYRLRANRFVKWDGSDIDPSNAQDNLEYIDQDSGFVMPELNWVSKTDALNEKYSFTALQLVPTVVNNQFRQDVWVASSDLAATGTGLTPPKGQAGLGGAVMAIGYRYRTAGSLGSPAGQWQYDDPLSGSVVARCDHIMRSTSSAPVPLANPRYFEIAESPAGRSLLICDNYGVYQVAIDGSGSVPTVVNHLWTEEYATLRRLESPVGTGSVPLPGTPPLMASSVQRLPNSKWLITNGYSGADKSGAQTFNGEVFEYDPNLGPGQLVVWCSPKVEWIPPELPATLPTMWKQSHTNTYNLRQPKSACRQ